MDTSTLTGMLAALGPDDLATLIDDLSPAEVDALTALLPSSGRITAWEPLPHQVPPDGTWWLWALVSGRGAGKTRAGAEWVNAEAMRHPGLRVGIVGPTLPTTRALSVEGESGLLAVNPSLDVNLSKRTVTWPNGSQAQWFGAYTKEDRERLRGPQWHRVWMEEFAAWRQLDEQPNPENPDCYQHITMALRLGGRGPGSPRGVVTTTPRRRRRLKEMLGRPDVVVSTASTDDNPHLLDEVRARLYEMFGGTRMGRQELGGVLLDDVEGALWREGELDQHRVVEAPTLSKVVVGVDPPAETAECGIVAVGVSAERWPHPQTGRPVPHGYVLADWSQAGEPEVWGRRVIDLVAEVGANYVVAETNQGGKMVAAVLRGIDSSVPVRQVRASKGKRARAEPVAALASQGLLHHVGRHPELEEQLTSWTDEDRWSPDRLDAFVWAASDLFVKLTGRQGSVQSARDRSVPGMLGR